MNMGRVESIMSAKQRSSEAMAEEPAAKRMKTGTSVALKGKEEVEEGVESFYKTVPNYIQAIVTPFERSSYIVLDMGLWCVPAQHSVNALFDDTARTYLSLMLNQRQPKHIIVVPKMMKVLNPIVLSDQIQVTASGSTEVSSFVQHAKIIHYRVGANNFNAHAYGFEKDGKLLRLDSKLVTGGSKSSTCDLLAQFTTSNGQAIVGPEGISMRAVTMSNSLVDSVDKLTIDNVEVPVAAQFGYCRTTGVNEPNVPLLPLQETPTHRLQDLAHDYLQPGVAIDLEMSDEVCFGSATTFEYAITDKKITRKQANVETQVPLFVSYPSYLNQSMRFGDGNRYAVQTHATSSRKNYKSHDFFTMVPIKKSDGQDIMKLRANVEVQLQYDIVALFTTNSLVTDVNNTFNWSLGMPTAAPIRETFLSDQNKSYINFMFH